jgi:hypothetical protein
MTPDEALAKLIRIAKGESREAFMSIPARPTEDADLVLASALAELDALRAELAKAEKWIALTNPLHGHNVKLKARAEAAEARVAKLRVLLRDVRDDSDDGHWLGGDLYAQVLAALEETKP